MFAKLSKNSFREAAFKARMEEDCFERCLRLAQKVHFLEVVWHCLPEQAQDIELNWPSVKCSIFDSNEKGD